MSPAIRSRVVEAKPQVTLFHAALKDGCWSNKGKPNYRLTVKERLEVANDAVSSHHLRGTENLGRDPDFEFADVDWLFC